MATELGRERDRLVPRVQTVAFDCQDAVALSRFWQQLLDGGELREDPGGEFISLQAGPLRLDFIRSPDRKQVEKNRLHLDLEVAPDVRREAVERAKALGATPAPDVYDGPLWEVLRDPEGNEFCIVWGAGD